MSESSSALFSIADDDEFRFARFYIVCEEVPLGTPESPPIVSGVSDMHPSDCSNVEETRIRCKYSAGRNAHIFFHRMFHLHFHLKSLGCISYILLLTAKGTVRFMRQSLFFISSLNRLHALRRLKAKQIDAGLKHRLRQL